MANDSLIKVQSLAEGEHSTILAMIGIENQVSVFWRVAVLHRVYYNAHSRILIPYMYCIHVSAHFGSKHSPQINAFVKDCTFLFLISQHNYDFILNNVCISRPIIEKRKVLISLRLSTPKVSEV